MAGSWGTLPPHHTKAPRDQTGPDLPHLSSDGPAYLGTWPARQGLPFEVFNTEAGHTCPANLVGYGALATLDGEMSANDVLPSLRQADGLFLQALATVRAGIAGHLAGQQALADRIYTRCLGLMAGR